MDPGSTRPNQLKWGIRPYEMTEKGRRVAILEIVEIQKIFLIAVLLPKVIRGYLLGGFFLTSMTPTFLFYPSKR